jgi:hypothetical protein
VGYGHCYCKEDQGQLSRISLPVFLLISAVLLMATLAGNMLRSWRSTGTFGAGSEPHVAMSNSVVLVVLGALGTNASRYCTMAGYDSRSLQPAALTRKHCF